MNGVWKLYRGLEEEREDLGWTGGSCSPFLPLLAADTPQPHVSAALPAALQHSSTKEMLKMGREFVRH